MNHVSITTRTEGTPHGHIRAARPRTGATVTVKPQARTGRSSVACGPSVQRQSGTLNYRSLAIRWKLPEETSSGPPRLRDMPTDPTLGYAETGTAVNVRARARDEQVRGAT